MPLGKKLIFRINPQLFHLRLDDRSGYYFASNFALASRKSAFSLGSTINKPLQSTIGGKPFDWNISVAYSLDKKLIVKK
jgi:hypothetical protein